MIKPQHWHQSHLTCHEAAVPAGREWPRQLAGWALIRIASGSGYWLDGPATQELSTGTVLLLADSATGAIRASQLGAMQLQLARIEPDRLLGLISLDEQRLLQVASAQPESAARRFPPDSLPAARLAQLYGGGEMTSLRFRLELLTIFVACLGDLLRPEPRTARVSETDAKERLRCTLIQMPAEDLLDLEFNELVQLVACTPRHLSRIFRELIGVSFREKQAELRLARALELLVTTDSKVVDVALRSGFQSLSLFNFMFKRRFRMSPSQWRAKCRPQPDRPAATRLALAGAM